MATWPIWSPLKPLRSSYGESHLLGGAKWNSSASHSSVEEFRARQRRRLDDMQRARREAEERSE